MKCSECGSALGPKDRVCPACGVKAAFSPPILPAASAQPPKSSATGVPVSPTRNGLPQPGDTFAGRYRVEKYLGLGSLCNAYLCRDSESGNKEMVLKIMHARKAAETGMSDSFLFLAESVSKYNHKGIAKIHAWGSHDGAPYYSMDWIPGTPLRLWLMERLNFENRVLPGLGIIRSLLDTFEAIHERGCYGSLKPENVFITLNGPVVMDFGVVGFLSSQEFEFNSYARRYIPYMAPELRQDWSNLLPHSDYYSLGALLYEILVGRAPAPQLRLPSELSRIFGIEADEIILKSMAANPMDRFGTLEAFKWAVESLQGTLMSAPPPAGMAGLPPAVVEDRPSADVAADAPAVKTAVPAPPSHSTGNAPQAAKADRTITSPLTAKPPQSQRPPAKVEAPQMASKAAAKPERRDRDEADEEGDTEPDAAAKTLIMPRNSAPAEGERTLSAFANLDHQATEKAHAQRRFAHAPITAMSATPEEESAGRVTAASEAIQSAKAWERLAGEEAAVDADWEEPEAAPVPAWLWAVIGLTGSALVALSVYFGMRMPG